MVELVGSLKYFTLELDVWCQHSLVASHLFSPSSVKCKWYNAYWTKYSVQWTGKLFGTYIYIPIQKAFDELPFRDPRFVRE